MPHSINLTLQARSISRGDREQLLDQKGFIVVMTGLSASGKSTIACLLERARLERQELPSHGFLSA